MSRVIITVLVLAITWLVVGSIDEDKFDDQGLLASIAPPFEGRNGYDEVEVFTASYEETPCNRVSKKDIAQLMYGGGQGKEDLEKIRHKLKLHLKTAQSAAQSDYFKFDSSGGVTDLPNYIDLMNVNRALLVESYYSYTSGDNNAALDHIKDSIKYVELLKRDKNYYLISYMIGVAMQEEVLRWVYQFSYQANLDATQFQLINTLLNSVSSIESDEFEKSPAGELQFGRALLVKRQDMTLAERVEEMVVLDEVSWDNWPAAVVDSVFSPYALHVNEVSNELASVLFDITKEIPEFCKNVSFPKIEDEARSAAWEILLPNSFGNGNEVLYSYYTGYLNRRCAFDNLLQATKIKIAMLRYQQDKHSSLEILSDLVPDYLPVVPIDRFTGEVLRYSKSQQWLYGAGSNFTYDGGAEDAIYRPGDCREGTACLENPTFPLAPLENLIAEAD